MKSSTRNLKPETRNLKAQSKKFQKLKAEGSKSEDGRPKTEEIQFAPEEQYIFSPALKRRVGIEKRG
ncbi:MAG: hypothetical protein GZ086_14790 [Gelidibacter sp.]|nr:hypothetical protein [Gelidibacter sp.]